MLADVAKRREIESRNMSVEYWKTETQTVDNIFGHRFSVPKEVYSDQKYRNKLNKARTLNEVENIIHDYRKHHRKDRTHAHKTN
jgi:hypothetical protein